jgi:hypothetical protein
MSRLTAAFGIGFFMPGVGVILLAIAGPLYLIWFPLIGRRLY